LKRAQPVDAAVNDWGQKRRVASGSDRSWLNAGIPSTPVTIAIIEAAVRAQSVNNS
jgi:hypothetical protein